MTTFDNQRTVENFWRRVDGSGGSKSCWPWTGAISNGYGSFYSGKKLWRAHRVAFSIRNNISYEEILDLDHRCGNRSCCNPWHLRTVTKKQNNENLMRLNPRNTSGVRGVYWNRKRGKWVAAVGHNYKTFYAGIYETLEEAEAAAIAKRLELFTHSDSR